MPRHKAAGCRRLLLIPRQHSLGVMFDDMDTTAFTDNDWAEWNKLQREYESGGTKTLCAALWALAEADPLCYLNIVEALNPAGVSDDIKDRMVAMEITREDVEEIIQKATAREHKRPE